MTCNWCFCQGIFHLLLFFLFFPPRRWWSRKGQDLKLQKLHLCLWILVLNREVSNKFNAFLSSYLWKIVKRLEAMWCQKLSQYIRPFSHYRSFYNLSFHTYALLYKSKENSSSRISTKEEAALNKDIRNTLKFNLLLKKYSSICLAVTVNRGKKKKNIEGMNFKGGWQQRAIEYI